MAGTAPQTVYIIGTWHHWQEGRPDCTSIAQDFKAAPIREFETLLRLTIQTHAIAAVVEEMGDERLGDLPLRRTLVGDLAGSLALPYLNTDLSERQRRALGYADPCPAYPTDDWLTLSDARERHWRQCLIDLDTWPALFICGGKHVHRFAALLPPVNIVGQIIDADWHPESN